MTATRLIAWITILIVSAAILHAEDRVVDGVGRQAAKIQDARRLDALLVAAQDPERKHDTPAKKDDANLQEIAAPQKKYAQDYFQSFRGEPANKLEFELVGLDPEQCVKFEPAGLRITLPTGHPVARQETGLRVHLDVEGDFEITLAFDVLNEPAPADAGFGTRLTLGIMLDTPDTNRNAALSRATNANGVSQFTAWAAKLPKGADKPQRIFHLPTAATRGRLRIVRTGADLAYFASEGDTGVFKYLKNYALSTADVTQIRLVGTTGGPKAALDVRFTDLGVRADRLPNVAAIPVGEQVPLQVPPARRGGWLLAGLVLGLATTLLLAFSFAAWLYWRQRRRDQRG